MPEYPLHLKRLLNTSLAKRFGSTFTITFLVFVMANAISYLLCSDSGKISDHYRCCGFPFPFWSNGGFDGRTIFSRGALWANIGVAALCSTLAALLRTRLFSWRSTIVIVALATAAIFLNFRPRGAWFEGGYGFPLLWYKYADVDLPDTGFRLGGFLVDALALVIVFKAVAHFLKPNVAPTLPEISSSHK